MNSKPTKVALLGAGYILHAHAKALLAIPGLELFAVCDLSRAAAERAAAEFSIPNVYTSLPALMASECDCVHVLLPPQLHADTARQLLEAGKHVLLEKPMALTSAECDALCQLARERGLRLGVSHNFLFLPGYERLRNDLKQQRLGRIDSLAINWSSALGLLQFGPFDSWMLRSAENLVFELGPHICAFALDLLGEVEDVQAIAAHPITMPGGSTSFRHWTVVARCGTTSVQLLLSVAPGETLKSIQLRGYASNAQYDFGRDVYWSSKTVSSSTPIDNALWSLGTAARFAAQAIMGLVKTVGGTLMKTPLQDPFRESIYRSVLAFHKVGASEPRLSGEFGARVIRLCEQMVQSARARAPAMLPSQRTNERSAPPAPDAPLALVVGGTGFIGKALVRQLLSKGVRVRVLSRNLGAARIELEGLPVEIAQGHHGDAATLDVAMVGVSAVYHLAKAVGQCWEDYVRQDVEPTRVLAEAALRNGVSRFIYTGTIDSYYSARSRDTINTDTLLDPRIDERNHYARSKATCEALLLRMHREKGLPLVIFRPGIVIGAGAPPAHWGVGKFHSDTRVQYWGDGDNKLPLVLVDDVAAGLVLGLDRPGIEGQAFLLTDAPLLSAKEYVAAVQERLGSRILSDEVAIWRHFAGDLVKEALKHAIRHPNRRRPSLRDWASRSQRASYDSAGTRQRLGWQPAGSRERMLNEGVYASVDWYMR